MAAGRHDSRNATRALYLRPGATTRVTGTKRAAVLVSLTALMLGLLGAVAPPAAANQAVAIEAGGFHNCVVRTDDTLACWGYNGGGQANPPAGNFSAVNAGWEHTCAIRSDDTLTCWGNNDHDQLDAPAGTFSTVSAGNSHNCAIFRTNDTLTCWGSNVNPFGEFSGQADPPTGNFDAVSAGGFHTCAIHTDYSLACWGDNNFEQLADVPTGSFDAVSAGGFHTCAIRTNDTLTCWGNNSNGQLNEVPTGGFSALSAGYNHTCAIQHNLTLSCWGSNALGQSDPPAGSFSAVSAGGFHTCAIRTSGGLVCWGQDSAGQAQDPDWTPPDTTIDSGPAAATTATDATFEFSESAPNSTFECRLDDAPSFTECASPQVYTDLAAGSHIFRVRAVSRWGVRDFSPDRWSWTITSEADPGDTTDPDTSITSGPDAGSTTPDPNPVFTFSSSEEGSTFDCSVDGAQPTSCTSPFKAQGLSDGPHTFSVTATDAAGNVDESPAESSFSVIAPTCAGERATRVTQDDGYLFGTGGDDVLVALGPDDQVIRSRGGNDIICAGGGDDFAVGGSDHDNLFGKRGDDVLRGGSGDDILNGGVDLDWCNGGSGTNDSATASCERKLAIP